MIAQEGFELRFRPRTSSEVTIQVPNDVLTSLQKIAESRDMPVEALIKLYVGQGLRQDSAKQFGDRPLEKAA
ncbi:MAG: hypothetical protein ACRD82_11770 [Blastocatellia bacterium]